MSERKVLNVSIFLYVVLVTSLCHAFLDSITLINLTFQKYYPPDFDPSKIPRMKLPRNRQYTVRLMAPFNMR